MPHPRKVNNQNTTPCIFQIADKTEDVAIRTITFWHNGFQIGDGDLRCYDDPDNAKALADINAGYVIYTQKTATAELILIVRILVRHHFHYLALGLGNLLNFELTRGNGKPIRFLRLSKEEQQVVRCLVHFL